MLRKSISVFLAASPTLKIDQRRQQPRQGFAQQAVESRPQKRLLEPPLEMQQAFEDSVQEPEKHRQSSL